MDQEVAGTDWNSLDTFLKVEFYEPASQLRIYHNPFVASILTPNKNCFPPWLTKDYGISLAAR